MRAIFYARFFAITRDLHSRALWRDKVALFTRLARQRDTFSCPRQNRVGGNCNKTIALGERRDAIARVRRAVKVGTRFAVEGLRLSIDHKLPLPRGIRHFRQAQFCPIRDAERLCLAAFLCLFSRTRSYQIFIIQCQSIKYLSYSVNLEHSLGPCHFFINRPACPRRCILFFRVAHLASLESPKEG